MATEHVEQGHRYIRLKPQEAVDLITLLSAQLANCAAPGNQSGACPSINLVEGGKVKARLVFVVYSEHERATETESSTKFRGWEGWEEWVKTLEVRDDVLGGEPVFAGTRISVKHIGKLMLRGAAAEVKEDYPGLTDSDLRFAELFEILDSPTDQ